MTATTATAAATTTFSWAGVMQLITARPLLFLILLFTAAACAILFLASSLARRKRRRARTRLSLVGRVGEVVRALDPEGFVLIDGELWPARLHASAGGACGSGGGVRVVGARGHLLEVEWAEVVARDVL